MENTSAKSAVSSMSPENGDPDHGMNPGPVLKISPLDGFVRFCGAARDMFGRMGSENYGFVQGFML